MPCCAWAWPRRRARHETARDATVVLGIGSAIVALVLTVLKVALMVLLPIALLWWVAKKLLAPERSY